MYLSDNVAGIRPIQSTPTATPQRHTIDGRRLQQPLQHGVYIENGQKKLAGH